MNANLLLRRLLLPVAMIVVAAAGAIVIIALVLGRNGAPPAGALIWSSLLVAVATLLGIAAVARAYARRQGQQIQAVFTDLREGLTASTIERTASEIAQRLRESGRDKAQLQTILSSMTDGLIAVDHEQRVLLSNRAAEQLLNVAPAAPAKHLWEAMPKEMHAVIQAASEVMLTAQPRRFIVGPIEGRSIEVTVSRLISVDGSRPGGLIIIAHDVTELQQYQELRKEFVANVSHELRTPLTVIKGYVETLRDGALHDPEAAQRHLATIQKHADQLTNLVGDLLDLSRLESDTNVPEMTAISIEPIMQRVIELMQPAAKIKQQTLALRLPAADHPLPQVMGNGDYLQRAIANLVDNAIKYTPQRGSIRVEARGEQSQVTIKVSDSGIGIAEEDLPRIFERFYRVDRSRSREMGGTGLGLSIVKHVVQSHGGTVDVQSQAGKGSTFTIELPASTTAAPPASAVDSPAALTQSSQSLNN